MRKYPEEFKREAVRLAAEPGMKVAQVEQDLGITPGLLYKWREKFPLDHASAERKPLTEAGAAAEIGRLRRELAIAREERAILKKALRVFSEDAPR